MNGFHAGRNLGQPIMARRPTKTFTMWRQAEGVGSRPSQRSVAPGGFLRLESDVGEVVWKVGLLRE